VIDEILGYYLLVIVDCFTLKLM